MNQDNPANEKNLTRKLSSNSLIREVPTQDELQLAWDEVDRNSSHRSAAIVGSAFVENAVRYAVSRRLFQLTDKEREKLFGSAGPLASFNVLIDVAYGLGIYRSLVRHDLHVIRRIRNAFAHAMKSIDFDTPEIVHEIKSFQFMRWRDSQPSGLAFGGPAFDNPHRETFARICRVFVNEIFIAGQTGSVANDAVAAMDLFSAGSYELPRDGF
jgi:hypothetical protein